LSGEGEPGLRIGPCQGGENQIVSAGPSPLLITRTKNRWPLKKGKPGSDHTRIGEELKKVRPTVKARIIALLLVFFFEMKNDVGVVRPKLKKLAF